ncbi:MAG: tRNA 2-thiocytidine(32) synthetase TtcA [Erysipelotrichia bacterium]|nr:tRNA 2-thiocytidine(32) synthetase TtcA [Erysipelotrichia bacterium]
MPFKQILGAVRKADLDYGLIHDSDRICVGVSGGKDSLLLLHALSIYRNIKEKYDHESFEVVGIHLNMGFSGGDFQPIRDFEEAHHVEYHDVDTRIYDILRLYPNSDGQIQCSRCSTLKKGAIVKAAKEYGCTKTAFAHHADDAVETLFLNMIYGGRIAVFEPGMHLERADMDFIRPFVYAREDDISNTALNEIHLPIVKSGCPNDGFTKRQDIKELLSSIYEKYPEARHNFLTAIGNQEQLKLWARGADWQKM